MSEVEILMKEWFKLKAQQTAKKKEIVKFHETYECTNMQSNGYLEAPAQCIYRSTIGRPVKDMCEPCSQRHNFYLERQANARRRTAILHKVRHILASPSPSETQLTLQDFRNELLNIPVRMGKKELGGILTANEIDQITALFQQALTSLKSEMEKKKLDPEFESGLKVIGYSAQYVEARNKAISECQRVITEHTK